MCAKIQTGGQLTLDQLRKINDEPVWVEDFGDANRSGWKLIHWDRDKYFAFLGINPSGFLIEEYGKTWAAFQYKPKSYEDTHKACELCKNANRIWGHAVALKISYGQAFRSGKYEGEIKFCPECGRPLEHNETQFEDVIAEAGGDVLREGRYIQYKDDDRKDEQDKAIARDWTNKILEKFREKYGYEIPFYITQEKDQPYMEINLKADW